MPCVGGGGGVHVCVCVCVVILTLGWVMYVCMRLCVYVCMCVCLLQVHQQEIFSECVLDIVESVLDGYNGSIIASGQTGR